jgi:integrase/recombinase XerD
MGDPAPSGDTARAQLLADAWLAGHSGRTREAYTTDLRQWMRWCAGAGIEPLAATRAHAQLWVKHLLEDLHRSKATVGRKLAALSGFYDFALAEDAIAKSPVAHVRRPRTSRESPRLGAEADELRALVAAARAHSLVAYALICLLGYQGLRISEACGARPQDITHERGHTVLTIRGKGDKTRVAPLSRPAAAAVQALLDAGGAGHGTLLGINRHEGYRLVRHLVARAGIERHLTPHSMRHGFVTLSLDAGVPLHVVQDAAGHADPRTTRNYDRHRHALDGHAAYGLADYLDGDTPIDKDGHDDQPEAA